MTRDEILEVMPTEISDRVQNNMIQQNEWETFDDNDYLDDLDFLMSAFSWIDSYEGVDYWAGYLEFTGDLDDLLGDCLSDE